MSAEAHGDPRRTHYKYIVVGCGGIGSGALYWLARRCGKDVLGLEQFELGHERGGSQDYSRIIRLLYHDKIYTNIVRDTYKAWAAVEQESGLKLVYKTGGLEFSHRDEPSAQLVERYAEALDSNNIPYEKVSGSQIRRRFPQFRFGDEVVGIYQAESGVVDAARGNAAHVQLARGHGTAVLDRCPVIRIETGRRDGGGGAGGHSVTVHTTRGTFTCDKVVVTAGAWINDVLGSVGVHIPVTVTQEQVTYFATPNMKLFTKDKFPVFIHHSVGYDIYGMPLHGNTGFKLGVDAGGPPVTANTRTFEPDPLRERVLREFIRKYVPEADGPIIQTKTCLYTMPPDRNFVIDTLAKFGKPQVIFCNGAGHAYKWASLLGKILSELAIDGRSQYEISGFTMHRPAITDPNFKPSFQMGKWPEQSSHL